MLARLSLISVALLICLPADLARLTRPPEPPALKLPDFSKLKAESIVRWSGTEAVVIGKLTTIARGPQAVTNPPVRYYKLSINPQKVLRGPGNFENVIKTSFSIKQREEPVFPRLNSLCVFALKFVHKAWVLQSFEPATEEVVEQAILATSFPIGWTVKDRKLVSPWAAVGKSGAAKGFACSVTCRPVLFLGDGIRFSIEPIPAARLVEFYNPDGDGEYKLNVKNETEKNIEVPALLSDGNTIRWNESIVIRCQNKTYPLPGSTGNVAHLKSVMLKPGETVSATVNVLFLNGPTWPGGGRVEFQFCLGERSATHSFYYFSHYHGPIRAKVQMELK